MLCRCRSLQLALVAAVAIVACSATSDIHAAEDLAALLARAGANMQALARSLAIVICNERHMQQFRDTRDKSLLAQRTLHSEVLFRWLAEEDLWLAIRSVKDIDGVVVTADSMPWEAALADVSPTERLRKLQTAALKYDIGPVFRTTADSTLVLRFLLPVNQPRFRFRDDGRVVRTRVDLKSARNLKVHLEVEFREDARLAAWVPSRMEERYETRSGQTVDCNAIYTDFRRFETAGRIVAPQ